MKKTFSVVILLFIVHSALYAQIEGLSSDSIPVYLSQKWKEKARFLDKHQIEIFGDPMEYEFKADRSFVKKYDNKTSRGTWTYDSEKKVVQLQLENKTDFYVVSLDSKQLLLADELREGPEQGSGILVLLHSVQ